MTETPTPTDVRRGHLFTGMDLSRGRTLEIGPLDVPLVTSDMAEVRYVDVVDRDRLVAQFSEDPSVETDQIPEIHHWLTRDDGSVSTLAEAVAADGRFHHVVASHVVEHVPDLVGWLHDVASVLDDDGNLLLVVPDRRFCFDARRSPATVGQVLQAYYDGDRIPSVRAVYDHLRSSVDFPVDQAWRGTWPPGPPIYDLEAAMPHVELQRRGEYVDSHVWPMTPCSFLDILSDLLAAGLVDFTVERITPTPEMAYEFYAVLQRLPRDGDREALRRTEAVRLAEIRAALPDEERTWPHQVRESELVGRVAELEAQLAAVRTRLARARTQRDRARTQRDRALAKGQVATGRSSRPAAQPEQQPRRLRSRVVRRLRRMR